MTECLWRRPLSRLNRQEGFTLVELLVVLIIIGLLAGIAIPLFTDQRNKGTDAQAKAATGLAQKAIETYSIENEGNGYQGADRAALEAIEATLTNALGLIVTASAEAYELETTSGSSTPVTFIAARNADGTTEHTCDPPDVGGCEGGSW